MILRFRSFPCMFSMDVLEKKWHLKISRTFFICTEELVRGYGQRKDDPYGHAAAGMISLTSPVTACLPSHDHTFAMEKWKTDKEPLSLIFTFLLHLNTINATFLTAWSFILSKKKKNQSSPVKLKDPQCRTLLGWEWGFGHSNLCWKLSPSHKL